jgi:hypothetical protein
MREYGAKHSKNNNGCYDYDHKFPLFTVLQWYARDVTKELREEQLKKIKKLVTPQDIIRTIVSLYKEKVLQDKFNRYFEDDPLVETSGVPWLSTFLEAFRQYQEPPKFVEMGSFLGVKSLSLMMNKNLPLLIKKLLHLMWMYEK